MTVEDHPEKQANPYDKTPYGLEPEPNLPIAFASVLDEKPAAAAPPVYGVAGDTAGYEPTATPTSTAIVAGSNPATVDGASAVSGRPIPPNAPPDGNWVRYSYSGQKTWGIIGITGCCLFWFCAMITAPCALFGLMCPCDEREGYMSPSGVIYDEEGKAMGDRRRNKYTVIAKA